MFYIGFLSARRGDEEGRPHAVAQLTLGAYEERFEASLVHWTQGDYELQWRDAVSRLAGGAATSALVSSYGGPGGTSSFWPIWREGSTAVLQERLVVPGDETPDVDAARPYELVGDRVSLGAEGPVPEWEVPLGQLLAYVLE